MTIHIRVGPTRVTSNQVIGPIDESTLDKHLHQFNPTVVVQAKREASEDLFAVGALHKSNPFQITGRALAKGFMGIYRARHFRKALKAHHQYGNVMAIVLQYLNHLPKDPFRKYTDAWGKGRIRHRQNVLAGRRYLGSKGSSLQLAKDGPKQLFRARVPVAVVNDELAIGLRSLYMQYEEEATEAPQEIPTAPENEDDPDQPNDLNDIGEGPADEDEDSIGKSEKKVMQGPNNIPTITLKPSDLTSLANGNPNITPGFWACILESVETIELASDGIATLMFFTFRLDKKIAESLCANEFSAINPTDLYSLLKSWISGGINTHVRRPPQYIKPLIDIKKSLSGLTGKPDSRINKDGLSISPDGHLYLLPEASDNIDSFNSELSEQLRNEDGTYAELDENGKHKQGPKLSVVYVDWVNQKITYTIQSGALKILNTDRFVKADPTHYANLLRQRIFNSGYLLNVLSYGFAACQAIVPEAMNEMSALAEGFKGLIKRASTMLVENGTLQTAVDIRLLDFLDSNMRDVTVYVNALRALDKVLSNDMQIGYSKYSVINTMEIMGFVRMMSLYETPDQILIEDNELRAKYINQGVDPDWEGESVPYVRDGSVEGEDPVKVMPHQQKTLNMTRESPDVAIFSIGAGGGKTPLSIIDYMREMRDGNVDRVLVLCPDHLVSTHVTAITDFLGGRVNVLPVTTAVRKRYGMEKLKEFMTRRPPNSVVVCGFDPLGKSKINISYGTETAEVFWVAEWLRQFNFDLVTIDEAHYLKNDSGRTRAVHRTIAGIKKKRLMSGTLAPNNILDLVRQAALIDPTIFGTEEEFKSEFALKKRGAKVLEWKPGTEAEVNRRLRSKSVYVHCSRKEWAAILPTKNETFISVPMSEAHMKVYKAIVQQTLDSLPPEVLSKLNSLMDMSQKANKMSNEEWAAEYGEDDDEAPNQDDVVAQAQAILGPHIERLEQFTLAPGADLLGATLGADEQVSAKTIAIGERCKLHLELGIEGKIIIFTNHTKAAEAIVEHLESLPEFSGKVVHYTAGNKETCKSAFEFDDNKIVMVGVGHSMDTGLNLQHASRLIRASTVWTPGKKEQGDARIWRPVVTKIGDKRKFVYIDTIVAAATVDVTKIALLMTKIIGTEKFYNSGNPLYDDLHTPEIFPMTMDNIFSMNDQETLEEYFNSYSSLTEAIETDYAEYREKHPNIDWTPVKRSPNLPGNKIMLRVPYAAETELYGSEDLGLIRYDQALNLDSSSLEESDDGDDGDGDETELEEERRNSMGLGVHTEFGDGEIVRVNAKTLWVRLKSGERVRVNKLGTFIIGRGATNAVDMKKALQQQNSPDIELDREPPTVPAVQDAVELRKQRRRERRQRRLERENSIESVEVQVDKVGFVLSLVSINDMLALQLDNADDDVAFTRSQQFGFAKPATYIYTRVFNYKQLLTLMHVWNDKGFTMTSAQSNDLLNMYVFMRKNPNIKNINPFGVARENHWKVFMRERFKANGDKTTIKPYPLIMDEKFYVALPLEGQAGTMHAARASAQSPKARTVVDPLTDADIRLPSKMFKWRRSEDNVAQMFVGGKVMVKRTVRAIRADGIVITNFDVFKKELSELKFRGVKKNLV